MELTLNQDVKMNYSFIKKVEEETLALIPNEYIFLENDIRLYVMIAMVTELSNEGINEIIEADEDIISKIENYFEPFFESICEHNPEIKNVFNIITDDIKNYLKERMEDNRHFASKVDYLLDLMTKMDLTQLEAILADMINTAPMEKKKIKKEQEDKKFVEDIKNDKLRETVEKFLNDQKTANS